MSENTNLKTPAVAGWLLPSHPLSGTAGGSQEAASKAPWPPALGGSLPSHSLPQKGVSRTRPEAVEIGAQQKCVEWWEELNVFLFTMYPNTLETKDEEYTLNVKCF